MDTNSCFHVAASDVLANPECPGRRALAAATSKWGLLVLIALSEGDRRYFELSETLVGISEKMLAETLRKLTAERFIVRLVEDAPLPRVSYSLTPLGVPLARQLRSLVDEISKGRPQGRSFGPSSG